MSCECALQSLPARAVAYIRTRVAVQDLPPTVGASYEEIGSCLREAGAFYAGPPYVAYYNMDMQDLDVEIGVPITGSLVGVGRVQYREMPAYRAATLLYIGPYEQIGAGYEALMAWVAAQGLEISGTGIEWYLNDPTNVPPQALQTLITFPLLER